MHHTFATEPRLCTPAPVAGIPGSSGCRSCRHRTACTTFSVCSGRTDEATLLPGANRTPQRHAQPLTMFRRSCFCVACMHTRSTKSTSITLIVVSTSAARPSTSTNSIERTADAVPLVAAADPRVEVAVVVPAACLAESSRCTFFSAWPRGMARLFNFICNSSRDSVTALQVKPPDSNTRARQHTAWQLQLVQHVERDTALREHFINHVVGEVESDKASTFPAAITRVSTTCWQRATTPTLAYL